MAYCFELFLHDTFRDISDMYILAHYPFLSEDQSDKIRFPAHTKAMKGFSF